MRFTQENNWQEPGGCWLQEAQSARISTRQMCGLLGHGWWDGRGCVACIGEMFSAHETLIESRGREGGQNKNLQVLCEDERVILKHINKLVWGCGLHPASRDNIQWRVSVNTATGIWLSEEVGNFLIRLTNKNFSRNSCPRAVSYETLKL